MLRAAQCQRQRGSVRGALPLQPGRAHVLPEAGDGRPPGIVPGQPLALRGRGVHGRRGPGWGRVRRQGAPAACMLSSRRPD